jgi:hypothetical protein
MRTLYIPLCGIRVDSVVAVNSMLEIYKPLSKNFLYFDELLRLHKD